LRRLGGVASAGRHRRFLFTAFRSPSGANAGAGAAVRRSYGVDADNTPDQTTASGKRRAAVHVHASAAEWRSARTTNAIERLHEEFKRRIKTQTVLPSADTAAMLFWALLASGQINMRKIDGWQALATKPIAQPIDLAA